MRVAFINITTRIEFGKSLGLFYIISALKKSRHQCQLFIPNLDKNFAKKIIAFQPQIICYSLVSNYSTKTYLGINQFLKEHISFFAVFGGPHPTHYPEMIKEQGVDCICRGEGEEAITELLDKMENNLFYFDTLNFWFKNKNEVIKNDFRPLIKDIDSIPFPYRDNWNSYDPLILPLITSRGCPFSCSHCLNDNLKEYYAEKGNFVRIRSIANIMEEINCLNKFKIRQIHFADDNFTLDKERLSLLLKEYKKNTKIPFSCDLKVDYATEEMIKELKKSNCSSLNLCLETADESFRELLTKRKITNEDILQVSNWCHKHKIKTINYNLLRLPFETKEQMFKTINLNIQSRPYRAMASTMVIFPNTALHEYAVKNNILDKKTNLFVGLFKSDFINEINNTNHLFMPIIKFPFLSSFFKKIVDLKSGRLIKTIGNAFNFFLFTRQEGLNYAIKKLKDDISFSNFLNKF